MSVTASASVPRHSESYELIRATVRRFAERVLIPASSPFEKRMTPSEVEGIITQAAEVGIITPPSQQGFGLWQLHAEGISITETLQILCTLAEANAGLAFHLHQLALGSYLCRKLGFTTDGWVYPLVQGGNGLARGALARFLEKGIIATNTDHQLLEEYFRAGTYQNAGIMLQAAEPWSQLLVPSLDCDTSSDHPPSLAWQLIERADLTIEPLVSGHGLQEIPLWKIITACNPAKSTSVVHTKEMRAVFIQMLGLNNLALMAIGLGAIEHAQAIAREYVKERIQGGVSIAEHPAIQLFIGTIRAAITATRPLIEAIVKPPQTVEELIPIFGCRAVAHDLLCRAANDALQSLGGYGYMEEYGIERIVRDVNHLKRLGGTPSDLHLFIAAKELCP